MHLNQPINGMERTDDNKGYWLVAYDGGIFTFGNAKFHGSTGSMHLNQPVLGMERTRVGQRATGCSPVTAACSRFGDAKFYGSAGGHAPVVADRRDAAHADGRGYWMLTQNGQVLRVRRRRASSATSAAARNYGGANRLLVSPTGKGYWIATADGSVIAFGDAKRLGFPVRIAGHPVALMG